MANRRPVQGAAGASNSIPSAGRPVLSSSGGQSTSTSGSVGSPSMDPAPMTAPPIESTFVRLSDLDIHGDEAGSSLGGGVSGKKKKRGACAVAGDKTSRGLSQFSMKGLYLVKKKKRGARAVAGYKTGRGFRQFSMKGLYLVKKKKRGARAVARDKTARGLRQFSMKVCKKVESKGRTTYNEKATHFLTENPANAILTASQRRIFNDKMRETVVYIEVENPFVESLQESPCELTGYVHGGGVFYGPHGWILTCAHILENYINVRIRCFSETGFRDAELISRDIVRDIAVLRPRTPRQGVVGPEPYVQFAPSDYVDTGMEIVSIHHALDQVYSFGIGSIAYQSEPAIPEDSTIPCFTRTPNFRRVDDCVEDDGKTELKTYPPDMRVLQLNGIHGDHGSSGCPVFSSSGLLLGIQLFMAKRQNYCNTVGDILTFIEGIRPPRKLRHRKRKRRRKMEDTKENSSLNKKSKHNKDVTGPTDRSKTSIVSTETDLHQKI